MTNKPRPKKKGGKLKTKSKYMVSMVSSEIADRYSKLMSDYLVNSSVWGTIVNTKPPSKAKLAKLEKERLLKERKEKRRRSKKITMTVGEYEDKIEEIKDEIRYHNDY